MVREKGSFNDEDAKMVGLKVKKTRDQRSRELNPKKGAFWGRHPRLRLAQPCPTYTVTRHLGHLALLCGHG